MAYRKEEVPDAPFEFVKVLSIPRGQALLIKGSYSATDDQITWENIEAGNDFSDFGIITTDVAMPGINQRNYRQAFKIENRGKDEGGFFCEDAVKRYDEHFRFDVDQGENRFHRARSTLVKDSSDFVPLF